MTMAAVIIHTNPMPHWRIDSLLCSPQILCKCFEALDTSMRPWIVSFLTDWSPLLFHNHAEPWGSSTLETSVSPLQKLQASLYLCLLIPIPLNYCLPHLYSSSFLTFSHWPVFSHHNSALCNRHGTWNDFTTGPYVNVQEKSHHVSNNPPLEGNWTPYGNFSVAISIVWWNWRRTMFSASCGILILPILTHFCSIISHQTLQNVRG